MGYPHFEKEFSILDSVNRVLASKGRLAWLRNERMQTGQPGACGVSGERRPPLTKCTIVLFIPIT